MATKTKEDKKSKKEAAALQERAEAAVAAAAPAVVAEPVSSEAPVVAAEVTEAEPVVPQAESTESKGATTSEPQAEPTPRKTLPRVRIHGMERDTELGELFHKEFGDVPFTKFLLNVQILVANNAIEGELKDGEFHVNMTLDIMNAAAKQYREHREAWKTAHPQPAKPAQKSGEKNGNGNRNKDAAKPKVSVDKVGDAIADARKSMSIMKKHNADVDLTGPDNRIEEAFKAFAIDEPTESSLEKITKACNDAIAEARSLIVLTQDEKVNACLKAHKLPSSQVGQMIEKQQAAKAKLDAGDKDGAYQDYVALLTLIPKQASFNNRKGALERLLEGSNTPDWYVEEGKKGLAVVIKQAEGGDLNGAHDALTALFEKTERVIDVNKHSSFQPKLARGKSRGEQHGARR